MNIYKDWNDKMKDPHFYKDFSGGTSAYSIYFADKNLYEVASMVQDTITNESQLSSGHTPCQDYLKVMLCELSKNNQFKDDDYKKYAALGYKISLNDILLLIQTNSCDPLYLAHRVQCNDYGEQSSAIKHNNMYDYEFDKLEDNIQKTLSAFRADIQNQPINYVTSKEYKEFADIFLQADEVESTRELHKLYREIMIDTADKQNRINAELKNKYGSIFSMLNECIETMQYALGQSLTDKLKKIFEISKVGLLTINEKENINKSLDNVYNFIKVWRVSNRYLREEQKINNLMTYEQIANVILNDVNQAPNRDYFNYFIRMCMAQALADRKYTDYDLPVTRDNIVSLLKSDWYKCRRRKQDILFMFMEQSKGCSIKQKYGIDAAKELNDEVRSLLLNEDKILNSLNKDGPKKPTLSSLEDDELVFEMAR